MGWTVLEGAARGGLGPWSLRLRPLPVGPVTPHPPQPARVQMQQQITQAPQLSQVPHDFLFIPGPVDPLLRCLLCWNLQ